MLFLNEKQQRRLVLAKFRVKIKSLADEARTIRAEQRRLRGDRSAVANLWFHRTAVVRPEQRYTLLAYAFCRGKAYRTQEAKCCRPLTDQEVARIARIIRSLSGCEEQPTQQVSSWLRE